MGGGGGVGYHLADGDFFFLSRFVENWFDCAAAPAGSASSGGILDQAPAEKASVYIRTYVGAFLKKIYEVL